MESLKFVRPVKSRNLYGIFFESPVIQSKPPILARRFLFHTRRALIYSAYHCLGKRTRRAKTTSIVGLFWNDRPKQRPFRPGCAYTARRIQRGSAFSGMYDLSGGMDFVGLFSRKKQQEPEVKQREHQAADAASAQKNVALTQPAEDRPSLQDQPATSTPAAQASETNIDGPPSGPVLNAAKEALGNLRAARAQLEADLLSLEDDRSKLDEERIALEQTREELNQVQQLFESQSGQLSDSELSRERALLEEREESVAKQLVVMKERAAQLDQREAKLNERDARLNEMLEDLESREIEIQTKEQELENAISNGENVDGETVAAKQEELDALRQELESQRLALNSQQEQLAKQQAQTEESLQARENALAEREALLAKMEEELEAIKHAEEQQEIAAAESATNPLKAPAPQTAPASPTSNAAAQFRKLQRDARRRAIGV